MAGFSNITGDESIVYADNASFDGTERGGKMTTNGQLWIGATAAPHVRLGAPTSTGATQAITAGAGTLNFETNGAGIPNDPRGRVVTITTPGAYPYTTLATDYVIKVDSSSARTITPLGSPVNGQMYIIKDSVGSASVNNITVTPSGKNIDGAASFVINTNYGSITIVYNNTEWSVI